MAIHLSGSTRESEQRNYSLISLGPIPLIPLGLPNQGVKSWFLWASIHSLAIWFTLIGGFYLYHQHLEQQELQLAILTEPQVYDVLLIDQTKLNKALNEPQRLGYKVFQVSKVDKDIIALKVGTVNYKRKGAVMKAISMDNLMYQSYFANKPLTLPRTALAKYFSTGAIYAVHRPNNIYIQGGIVRPLPKPKPIYTRTIPNKANQRGIELYQQGAFEEAMAAFQEGANQGDSWAQYNLGDMYLAGQGATANQKQACFWFNQAAKQGHDKALVALEQCD